MYIERTGGVPHGGRAEGAFGGVHPEEEADYRADFCWKASVLLWSQRGGSDEYCVFRVFN